MKKRKTLGKKIRRLQDRLKKDAKKLARLTSKLGVAVIGRPKARKTAAAKTKATKSAKSSKTARKAAPRAKRPAAAKAAAALAKPVSATPLAKKKLNLSPERRAQLSAQMKARWDAKRAAVNSSQASSPA